MYKKILSVFAAILTLILILTQIAPHSNIHNEEHNKSKNILISSSIYNSINTTLAGPIIIASGMSADTFLQKTLKDEENLTQKEIEAIMSEYLSAIKEKFGYTAAFVISEKTHRYFTPKGISRIIAPKEDPYDIWYQFFLDSNKDFDLDTDRDQVNDYKWTIFINMRIKDKDGSLLGVCGIGLFIDDLQAELSRSEKEYGVKINLIDPDGLVQADTDSTNIENAYIYEAISDNALGKSYVYTDKGKSGFRLTRYMDKLEWFLVVQGFASQKRPLIYDLTVILLALIMICQLFITLFSRKATVHTYLKKSATTEDLLTGLPNRNYLKESYGELGIFNTLRYKSLVMFDIDRFKTINESRDGDKIILGVVEHAKDTVGEKGLIFRWSGDEFVVFSENEAEETATKFKELCEKLKNSLDITISVGIVKIDFTKSIKTNYHRAVQACYLVKEEGGNGVEVKK